jgi:hypothetical protein
MKGGHHNVSQHQGRTRSSVKGVAREQEFSEATRFAQYTLLVEIPGLIFGVITVAYIASFGR